MEIVTRLEKLSKISWVIIGFLLIFVIGLIDYLTGFELAFSFFYVLPISLVAWFADRRIGLIASFVSAIIWFLADIYSGQIYSQPVIYYWNTAIRLAFFIIVTLLLTGLKKALEHEKNLSRSDSLTGAISSNYFYDLLQIEIDRSQRYQHPYTVAYFDLDNFKAVNDQFGHSEGDRVLCTIVNLTREKLRKTDIIARLGGDEFVILFPETDPSTAQMAISKIHQSLLTEMKKNNWPVTFSIGVITFLVSPGTTNELIKKTDSLMYSVKNNGKNSISYAVFDG
jgi:diguanylate cyclase (GGDEF)-like protein